MFAALLASQDKLPSRHNYLLRNKAIADVRSLIRYAWSQQQPHSFGVHISFFRIGDPFNVENIHVVAETNRLLFSVKTLGHNALRKSHIGLQKTVGFGYKQL